MKISNQIKQPWFIVFVLFFVALSIFGAFLFLKTGGATFTFSEDFSDLAFIDEKASKNVNLENREIKLLHSAEDITPWLEKALAEDGLHWEDWYLSTAATDGQDYLIALGDNYSWYPNSIILKLDSSGVKNITPPPSLSHTFSGVTLTVLSYGNNEWLLGGYKIAPDGKNKPFLAKYDGINFINLSDDLTEEYNLFGRVASISFHNDGFWLISCAGGEPDLPEWYWYSRIAYLFKYDGEKFTDLSYEFHSAGFIDGYITVMANNGQYFLLGCDMWTGPALIKYNGERFIDLTEEITRLSLSAGISNVSIRNIDEIDFNGEYWVIGVSRGFWLKYDGVNFTPLNFPYPGHESSSLDFQSHNWLIGTYGGKVVKYDGEKFIDLNPAFPENAFEGSWVKFIVAGEKSALVSGPGNLYLLSEGATIFKPEGVLVSRITSPSVGNFKELKQATLKYEADVSLGSSLSMFLSSDSGFTWEKIENNRVHSFLNKGSQLAWKAELATDGDVSPKIKSLKISYLVDFSSLFSFLLITGVILFDLIFILVLLMAIGLMRRD